MPSTRSPTPRAATSRLPRRGGPGTPTASSAITLSRATGNAWIAALFRLRDSPPGEREDLIRRSLWSRNQKGVPQAVVSHETALIVHELSDVMPARVHLTVPPEFRKRTPPGGLLHKDSVGVSSSLYTDH